MEPRKAQTELEQELTNAARTTANKTSVVVARNALRNVLDEFEDEEEPRTDGGQPEDEDDDELPYPREYNYVGSEHGKPRDALDELRPGDRVLWGDRKVPCTVARVVDREDRIGQSLTASVISRDPRNWLSEEEAEDAYLEKGDVFLNPDAWGTLRGKRFVVIQGPRGGFYALAEPESGRNYPALFRAVRSFHSTKMGQPGQGAWDYEGDFDYSLEVVENGEEPDELDPEGDLPAYEDIAGNRLVSYEQDEGEHYTVGTVEEAFDEGLVNAHERAEAEFLSEVEGDGEDEEESEVPPAEEWEGTPSGHTYSHSTVEVTAITETKYGLKAVLDGPAPWETPDDERPMNEVLKSTPWEENHRTFDSDRKAWTVDADELTRTASVLKDCGYSVRDARDDEE